MAYGSIGGVGVSGIESGGWRALLCAALHAALLLRLPAPLALTLRLPPAACRCCAWHGMPRIALAILHARACLLPASRDLHWL